MIEEGWGKGWVKATFPHDGDRDAWGGGLLRGYVKSNICQLPTHNGKQLQRMTTLYKKGPHKLGDQCTFYMYEQAQFASV